jgi:hypothetical protein
MSLDKPPQNKMMTEAPNEKCGWHFASDGIHKAMYVWAHSIEEAEKIYHGTKELISQPAQSTAPAPKQDEGVESN